MKKFLQMFQDSDGMTSMSRVNSTLTIVVVLALLTFIAIRNHQFPDQSTLIGLGMFAASVVGVLMGTNHASDIVAAWKGSGKLPVIDGK